MHFSGPDDDGVVTITASGTLTRDDYDRNLPALERLLDERGPLPFLILLDGVNGIELGALWEDLKFDIRYRDRFGRMAVVGDKRWEAWGTRLASPFFKAELRYFDMTRGVEARAWVRQ